MIFDIIILPHIIGRKSLIYKYFKMNWKNYAFILGEKVRVL